MTDWRATLWRRLPEVLWLLAVWLMLWGSLEPLIVLYGVVVSVAVVGFFALPLIESKPAIRPLRLTALIGYLAVDLVKSSVQIGWQAIRHGRRIRAAVIRVPLQTDAEAVIVLLANLCSFGPGKVVLQIDRRGGCFYVYGFPARDAAQRERMYDEIMLLQRAVLRAFAPADEVRALRAGSGGSP